MLSYIIYNNTNSNKNEIEYGIKKINTSLYNKIINKNKIDKKFNCAIKIKKLIEEFGEKNLDIEKKYEEYDDNDLVNILYMGELNKNQLEIYLGIYEDADDNDLEKLIEFLSIITYKQINPEKFKVKKKIDLLLNSLSEFWEDKNNCNYTLTNTFNKRKFNNNSGDDIFNINLKIKWNSKEINYLNNIVKFNDFKDMCINNYYISSNKSEYTQKDIVNIFHQLPSEYTRYNFICNMLCSHKHCHLILNNKEFLEISTSLFNKYKLVFKYLIGYAWLTLKNEEMHIYHKITDSDRIIFDIDTLALLPVYPFSFDDINQNPYACLLIDNNILDIKNNCLTLEMMRDYNKYYGVCDSNEFKRRLNIFVNGNNKLGVLDYIDWDCCAISGSVMTACGMKRNPLMDLCKTNNNMEIITDDDLSNYFFHYYSNSDIDLICNKKSIWDFIQVVDNFVSKVKNKYDNVLIENIHSGAMMLSDEFILNELNSICKYLNLYESINVDYIKSNLNKLDIKKYFYTKYYLPWKNEQKEFIEKSVKNFSSKLIKDYLNPATEDEFKLFIFDYELDVEKYIDQDYEKYYYSNLKQDNKIIAKLSESIRFKISNPNIRTFEIFKSRNENFFSIVSRFHMGFVRSLWNGKTVLCLPSFASSMFLQFSSDYKYFASKRNPIEIINKYRSRGWGIILNKYEKLCMAYYNSCKIENDDCNAKWIEMYKVNYKSKQSVEKIFGTKKSSDEIFKMSKYLIGIPDDCYKNINHDTVSSFDECFSSIITQPLLPIAKFKAINDDGKINPLSRDVINLGFNLLNK